MKTFKPANLALVAFLALGACGGDSGSATPSDDMPTTSVGQAPTTAAATETDEVAGAEAVEGDTITIANFAYAPAALKAAPGAEITVTNNDEAIHTLTAVDKSVDTGTLEKGQSATVSAPQSGELAYFCTIHEYMKGAIRVTG